jgi:hypothetical protein
MPYTFLERDFGGREPPVIVAVESRFVEIFGRRVRIGMPIGEGVDESREATKGAKRCAAAFERERGGEMQEGRK